LWARWEETKGRSKHTYTCLAPGGVLTTTGREPIAAGRKAPAKYHHKPIKNASTKAKKGQTNDDDSYPYVARARPERSTTKKDHKAPPDNSTDDESSASESHCSPQQSKQDTDEESDNNSSDNNGINDDSMFLLMRGDSDSEEERQSSEWNKKTESKTVRASD
jgi:hypothetical protein